MKKLSLISHYYNTHNKAQELLDYLAKMDSKVLEQIEIIIVDDCSNEELKLDSHGLDLKNIRIIDNIPWNQSGCRNLGAMITTGRWCLFFDIDQKITPMGLAYTLDLCDDLDINTMYYFYVYGFVDSNTNETLHTHPNTFLVNSNTFRINGMFDEDFAGNYGYEDLYLPYMWERNGGGRAVVGDTYFFVDQEFKTTNLSRDLEPNKIKSNIKLRSGFPRPKNFIRFTWKMMN